MVQFREFKEVFGCWMRVQHLPSSDCTMLSKYVEMSIAAICSRYIRILGALPPWRILRRWGSSPLSPPFLRLWKWYSWTGVPHLADHPTPSLSFGLFLTVYLWLGQLRTWIIILQLLLQGSILTLTIGCGALSRAITPFWCKSYLHVVLLSTIFLILCSKWSQSSVYYDWIHSYHIYSVSQG